MSGNNLLLWMSARGQGSFQQFRMAIEQLRVEPEDDFEDDTSSPGWGFQGSGRQSPYSRLRLDFHSLSHADFGEQDWRITPSTIALTTRNTIHRGVMNGGRSPKLLEALHRGFPGLEITFQTNSSNPDVVSVSADSLRPLTEFANDNGLYVQQDAATRLLVGFGHLFNTVDLRSVRPPPGPEWQISRFSTRSLSWVDATQTDVDSAKNSLFRYSTGNQSFGNQTFFFISRFGRTSEIGQQFGKYMTLERGSRRVLQYDFRSETLFVPGVCRPPRLVDRALILCSGEIPEFDYSTRRLSYSAVMPHIAKLAANVLRQGLLI